MPRLKRSGDLLEDRRRRALGLWDTGVSLNEVGRRIRCAPSSVMRWLRARRRDRLADPPHLVTAEIVENRDVSRPQDGYQALVHIGPKHLPVHGPVRDHRRDQLPLPQCPHESGSLPVTLGDRSDATLPPRCAPVTPCHVRCSPRFINKYEPIEIKQERVVTPRAACLPHVVALLLAGVQGFF